MQQFSKESLVGSWQAIWDRGEVDVLDDLVGAGYERVSASTGHVTRLEDLKTEIRAIREGLPDLRTVVNSVVVDGDRVAVFWTSEGTHTEPLLGVPPTHRRVRTSGSNLLTLHGGRIATETVTWDGGELLASLGIRSLGEALPGVADEQVVVDDLSGFPDVDVMKNFNRQFVTGVTIVSTVAGDEPRGLAVNSYASISLEPPLVLICVQKTSSTYPALFASTHLGINIMAAHQRETVDVFAKSGTDKFATVPWHSGPQGSPLIDGSSAAIEAEIRDRFQAQTHTLFVCRVTHAEVTEEDPMVYLGGRFFHSSCMQPL